MKLVYLILIFITFLVSLNMGSLSIKPVDVLKTLIGQGSKAQEIAIFKLRLPRIVIGILVGTALATSGAILQGVTKNDLADSGILGINSGSALFVVMYIYFMNLTLGYIAFLASSFLSLNVTLFCSNRLSPLASIDTISGPNSLTLQHHNVSGIPSSSQ